MEKFIKEFISNQDDLHTSQVGTIYRRLWSRMIDTFSRMVVEKTFPNPALIKNG